MSFQELDLDPCLLRALDACGFSEPTEIQKRAIPLALAGRDLMASAQTGTGKTAAFVLPSLQRLLTPSQARGNGPRMLILTPTRELANQVTKVVQELGKFARLRWGTIVGGMPYPPQFRLLRAPLDVLVATPGRLMDHMERGSIDFSRVEVLVLDEADRMLDMGFVDAVTEIAESIPGDRQTLLFSATLDRRIDRIVKRHLNNPERIQLAAAKQRHESIDQWMHKAGDLKHKKAILSHILSDPQLSQAVVFTATKRRANDLAEELMDEGHACAPLHGDMSQAARQRTMEKMRRGRVKVLVATDVAARGLDVPGITHVINFEMPMTAEDYIHRIGRTGRAGAKGVAISLVGRQEWHKLNQVERLTGRQVAQRPLPRLTPAQGGAPADRPERPKPEGARFHDNNETPRNHWKKRSSNQKPFGKFSGKKRKPVLRGSQSGTMPQSRQRP